MMDTIKLRRVANQRIIASLEQEPYHACPNLKDKQVGCLSNLGIGQLPCGGCSIYLSLEDENTMWII